MPYCRQEGLAGPVKRAFAVFSYHGSNSFNHRNPLATVLSVTPSLQAIADTLRSSSLR